MRECPLSDEGHKLDMHTHGEDWSKQQSCFIVIGIQKFFQVEGHSRELHEELRKSVSQESHVLALVSIEL